MEERRKAMKIAVIGTGYVGTTTATVLASLGYRVCGADSDKSKVEQLNRGILPFVEPGLEPFLRTMQQSGRLNFSHDVPQTIRDHQVLFLAVGTPSQSDGKADLRALRAVAEQVARDMQEDAIIVVKSTVPVGTNRWLDGYLRERVAGRKTYHVISNPEFLREGNALADMLRPSRTIIGGNCERAMQQIANIYRSLQGQILFTDWETAELTKYAANAFLAAKISFINEMARIADKSGADITKVAQGIGLDPRIGQDHLQAGIGYGGSCFPKDVRALLAAAQEVGVEMKMLKAVEEINKTQIDCYLAKLFSALQAMAAKPWTLAVLGLSFKAGTDDQRESPALHLIKKVWHDCREIRVYDPVVRQLNGIPPWAGQKVIVCPSSAEALKGADAAVICTAWEEFTRIDWSQEVKKMAHPLLLDGRNLYHPAAMRAAGVHYLGVGRGNGT